MSSFLFADVVEWVRGGRGTAARARQFRPVVSPPQIELLEERCLLSSTTTIPAMAEVPGPIAQGDILAASQPKGNPSVVFVGDSISWQYAYGTGAPVWWTLMAPLGMANYGVTGQTTQSLLFQFSLGQLSGITPSVVVLDIGGNNLLHGDSPQATAEGVLADVATIHQYLPQSQIVVLGVLPGKESPQDPYRQEGAQTNQLVSQMLAGDPKATFVNFGAIFVQPDGTISTYMMFDYLHPTELGYIELTMFLLPVIEQQAMLTITSTPTASEVSSTDTSPPSDSSAVAALTLPSNLYSPPSQPVVSTPPA
jgi:beta-glucosidase